MNDNNEEEDETEGLDDAVESMLTLTLKLLLTLLLLAETTPN
jgi:hypothetical protein